MRSAGGAAPFSKLVAIVVAATVSGCGSCSSKKQDDKSVEVEDPLVDAPPLAKPWSLQPVKARSNVAAPSGCRERAPILRADVGPSSRFLAEPRTLGALFVAELDQDEIAAAALLRLDDSGTVREIRPAPWIHVEPPPRLALAPSGRLFGAATKRAGKAGDSVAVWTSAGADAGPSSESLGAGDGFDVLDAACGNTRCAVLTTRQGRVAAPGAEVRVGSPATAVATWRRIEIAPAAGDSDAEPALIASIEPKLIVAVAESTEVVFFDADSPTPAREIARLAAPAGLLDAAAGPEGRPVALVHGAPIGEDGCTKGGLPGMLVQRSGAEGIAVSTPAAPLVAALRPLSSGLFLATWLAPLGCGNERRVVYGQLLRPDGTPAHDPLPLADGTAFSVATSGADADVWIRQDASVTWLRITCPADPGKN